MNRKDRRRLEKQARTTGRNPPRPGAVPRAPSVSDLLLQHAGQQARPVLDPAALERIATDAAPSPVDMALAEVRRRQLLDRQVEAVEGALQANPNDTGLLETLAKLHRHRDDRAGALAAYRRILAIDPSREDVKHMVAALSNVAPAEAPARAADAYITSEFDGFAARYDEVLVGALEYRGPDVILQAVQAVLGPNPPPQDVIDLGCGTGLAGRLLRPLARRLDGVDLSAKMVEQARARGVYDELAVDEIVYHLLTSGRRYTLAVAADVLIYFGDLEPLMRALSSVLLPGGLFAFTVEAGEGAPYRLTPSGRYAHDDAYVRAAAAAAGFTVARATDETVRKEKREPVKSRCYVLRMLD
ncbi:MAG TPA: methyltransferase domain-containing protein [Alphaproteobacteria bacterium]